MQSTSSTASDGSETVNQQIPDPVLVKQENEKAAVPASPSVPTVAENTQKGDFFLVQIDMNDPAHPRVCVSYVPRHGCRESADTCRDTHLEPLYREEVVPDDAFRGPGVEYHLFIFRPRGCY